MVRGDGRALHALPQDLRAERAGLHGREDGVRERRGRRLHGVAWKLAHRLPPLGAPIDLAVELKWNHFNGRKLLQLVLLDWRHATGG